VPWIDLLPDANDIIDRLCTFCLKKSSLKFSEIPRPGAQILKPTSKLYFQPLCEGKKKQNGRSGDT
jgi:hypothetical protein